MHSAIGTRIRKIINRFHSYLLSVTVSVITIKGTESRLLELGRVADITGGQVDLLQLLIFSLIPRSCIIIQEESAFPPPVWPGYETKLLFDRYVTAMLQSLFIGECG